jgi:CRP-like cAMP-binding protein
MAEGEDPKTDAVPEMYQRLLQSDYPAAITLARRALDKNPGDRAALNVLSRAEAALRRDTTPAPRPPPDALEASFENLGERLAADDPDDSGELSARTDPTSPTRVVSNGSTAREMARAFLDSDYPRALALAHAVLAEAPGDAMAAAVAKECGTRNELASSIPVRVAMLDDRVDADEDAVAASVLSLVDGRTTVAEIAEASGLSPAEAVRLIEDFVACGVLRLDDRGI